MEEALVKCDQLGREPRIWKQIPGYVIRNVTPDLYKSVVHHMITHFIVEETFCSSSKVHEDPFSVKELEAWWSKMVSKQNVTLIALPEGSPGADLKPITEPLIRLAGVNVLSLSCKNDPPKPYLEEIFQGKAIKNAIGAYMAMSEMVDCFKFYDVDLYMDAAGLYVHPEERKRGLGDALLKARFEMCRDIGIKATKTVFTGIASQKVALRCGFEIIKEVFYKDIKNKEGQPNFPNVPPMNRVLITGKKIDI